LRYTRDIRYLGLYRILIWHGFGTLSSRSLFSAQARTSHRNPVGRSQSVKARFPLVPRIARASHNREWTIDAVVPQRATQYDNQAFDIRRFVWLPCAIASRTSVLPACCRCSRPTYWASVPFQEIGIGQCCGPLRKFIF